MALVTTKADALRLYDGATELQHLIVTGTLPGIAILQVAAKNGPGTASLRTFGDGTKLAWQEPGQALYGVQVDVTAGGNFLLEGGTTPDAWCRVNVTAARLLAETGEARILLSDVFNNKVADDDITAAEATSGGTFTHTALLQNDGPDTVSNIKIWLDPAVPSTLDISLDGASWVHPTSEGDGDVLTIASIISGGTDTLHFRRIIAAAASSDPDVLSHIHYSWEGV